MILRLPTFLAALVALAIARRMPRHRPVAAALTTAWLADSLQDLAPPSWPAPHVALAVYLALPALSAWCALRVLAGVRPRAAALLTGVAWALAAALSLDPRVAHVLAVLVQFGAAAQRWRSRARRDLPELCALVLLAGDVVGLVSPLMVGEREDWGLVSGQAAIVGAALVILQVQALARGSRRGDEVATRARSPA
jgi:hypothetical protein